MTRKARAIAVKMKRPDEIRASLQDLWRIRKDTIAAGNDITILDSRISILNAVWQTIQIEIKRGATDEEAILQGARKILDLYCQIEQEAIKHPKIGRDAYNMLPPEQTLVRQLVLARCNTILWVMGEEEKNEAVA